MMAQLTFYGQAEVPEPLRIAILNMQAERNAFCDQRNALWAELEDLKRRYKALQCERRKTTRDDAEDAAELKEQFERIKRMTEDEMGVLREENKRLKRDVAEYKDAVTAVLAAAEDAAEEKRTKRTKRASQDVDVEFIKSVPAASDRKTTRAASDRKACSTVTSTATSKPTSTPSVRASIAAALSRLQH